MIIKLAFKKVYTFYMSSQKQHWPLIIERFFRSLKCVKKAQDDTFKAKIKRSKAFSLET